MEYALKKTFVQKNFFYSVSLIAMAVLLNQSSVINNINITLADIFCVFLLLYFLIYLKLKLPAEYCIFFFILSSSVLATTAFIDPQLFLYTPEPNQVMKDYVKLLMLFVYFLAGYNIAGHGGGRSMVKWYCISALIVGILGLAVIALKTGFLSDTFLYAGIRLKGFMNDPNFFSVLQVTSLAYFMREKKIKTPMKVSVALVIALTVLASGSKTGLLVLMGYFVFLCMEFFLTSWKRANQAILLFLIVIISVLTAFLAVDGLTGLLQRVSDYIPSFSRINGIFSNFGSAISEGGSGRDTAWETALGLIRLSPASGIGIGVYPDIAFELFGERAIAHNTYLQLAAEWGLPLAGIFFAYIVYAIGKVSLDKNAVLKSPCFPRDSFHKDQTPIMARDILIIVLFGSFGVSLNNARILWLFLGVVSMYRRKTDANTRDSFTRDYGENGVFH